jgi:hypothetical protein
MRVVGVKLVLEDQQDGHRQQDSGQQDRKSWFHVTILRRRRFSEDVVHILMNMTAP